MTRNLVRRQRRGPVLTLTLDRPEALNALNGALLDDLAAAIVDYEGDDELRVAVLRGSGGRAFSAGADLKEMAATDGDAFPVPAAGIVDGLAHVERCEKPVIAAIDGYCLAGGLELALVCDMRFATRSSSFGMPEVRWNLLGGPALQLLSRTLPSGEAMLMHLSGQPIDAERAYQLGFVQGLASDRAALDTMVRATADAVAACAPGTVRTIKHLVRAGRERTVADARAHALPFQQEAARSAGARAGTRSFAARPRA